jgi:putative FmdB family regulatory protein
VPTYKYRREDGTTFTEQQSIKEDPLEECPVTGQPVERVIEGAPSIQFNGDGFHVNDYSSNNPAS